MLSPSTWTFVALVGTVYSAVLLVARPSRPQAARREHLSVFGTRGVKKASADDAARAAAAATQIQAQQQQLAKRQREAASSSSSPSSSGSSSHTAAAVDALAFALEDRLFRLSPRFTVPAANVQPLGIPNDFFEWLLAHVATARKRIVMSSLYIGSGAHSRRFVAALQRRLEEAAAAGEQLEVLIVLDYNRMHDAANFYTIEALAHACAAVNAKHQESSASAELCRIRLFQPPSFWAQIAKPFNRGRELLGVQHTKLVVIDDTVLLTGANLSDDYFTNRIDRYIAITEAPRVAAWYVGLAETLAAISHPLIAVPLSAAEAAAAAGVVALSEEEVKKQKKAKVVFVAAAASPGGLVRPKRRLVCDGRLEVCGNATGFDPDTQHTQNRAACVTAMRAFVAAHGLNTEDNDATNCDASMAVLFPTVQFARVGCFNDFSVVEELLSFPRRVRDSGRFTLDAGATELLSSDAASPTPRTPAALSAVPSQTALAAAAVGDFETAALPSDDPLSAGTPAAAAPLLPRIATVIASPYLNTHVVFVNSIFKVCRLVTCLLPPSLNTTTTSTVATTASARANADAVPSYRIVTCSPKTNGWKSSKKGSFAAVLPQLYFALVRHFYFLVKDKGFAATLRTHEYTKPDTTFHAKGLWLGIASDDTNDGGETQVIEACHETSATTTTASPTPSDRVLPFATAIGSNNFGVRCVLQDVEAQAVIVTRDLALRQRLRREMEAIVADSTELDDARFTGPEADSPVMFGRFQPVIALVAALGSNYM